MSKISPVYILAALIGLAAMFSGFTDKRILFINGTKTAVIVLAAAGFLMCSTGVIGLFVTKGPGHPLAITGYLFGVLAMVVAAVQIWGLKVPYLSEPKNGLIVLTAIILIKVVIGRFNFLLH